MHPNQSLAPNMASMSAAVSLLADSDVRVAAACSRKLLDWGESAREALLDGIRSPDARIKAASGGLLRALDLRRMPARLHEALNGPSERVLMRGIASLAEMDRKVRFDRRRMTALVEMLGAELARMLRGRASASRCLADLLGRRLGFTVDVEATRRLEAHRLDSVLQRRIGSAAALVAVYVLVGRSAGLEVTGVRMLSHHLVRVHGRRPTLLAPAAGGQSILKADCARYLRDAGWRGAKSELLLDQTDSQLLSGLAEQMRMAYCFHEDVDALKALDAALVLLS